jgi:hypothetical protein
MTLNELTNADAIEAVREETREVVREETWDEAWKKASEVVWKKAREVTWKEASEATSEATQQQVFALIDQGLTGEQIKQALQRGHLRVVPKPPSGYTDVE